ncbi:AraC-like DNA-binding protein [Aneurinibacillus soli]|uniref:HTH-type transcriptional regulator YesS n=1 Tax=Aneurinibacillus soli TaxID=1500254 RepID=A0A0U5AYH5_9BACL|nr:AraC family transcriptional regulator [Aneurinibacillus soli]PYE57145.1 AraC-like DNA-binding protein [Aneurinibacillus soli]BAU25999.1 HTH-type transcriptional regulator YesS [Aneurinibacillus soli]
MYIIQLIMQDAEEKEKISTWMREEFGTCCQVEESTELRAESIHILLIEIHTVFDWVKINRVRKINRECRIIPILAPSILSTSPIAIEMKLPSLFIKPLKKSLFLRTLKRNLEALSKELDSPLNYQDIYEQVPDQNERDVKPFQEAFLRRLLRDEVRTEAELIQTRSFFPGEAIPNIVCFIQGFVRFPERERPEEWDAAEQIRQCVQKHLGPLVPHLFFLSYRKHMLLLLRIPEAYPSLRCWEAGQSALLSVITELEEEQNIHIYIGVGEIYREPLALFRSYREARKARRTPPYERLSLRYHDQIADDKLIQQCSRYINEHYTEDLTVTCVAGQVNLSPAYFSRLFKKETGRSFVEYVTFVRLQRAIWLLRHTNKTIEQIAEELGFNTPNYFSAIFKKYAGLAPSEYRGTIEIIFV